jgi:hypothetical protein
VAKSPRSLNSLLSKNLYGVRRGDASGNLYVTGQTVSSNFSDTFHKFDSQGRDILDAMPSAVTGYNSTYADLLHYSSGSYQFLASSSGPIELTDYASATTPTSSTAGNAAGDLMDTKVEEGQSGTAITTFSEQYYARAGDEGTIYPVASTTDYPNANGSGSLTTTDSYTWVGMSDGEASVTETLPVVSSGQDGPGTADTSTTVFDTYGNGQWTRDGDGFLTYTATDPAIDAVPEVLSDVNTSNTTDFSNLPSGWSTPSGGRYLRGLPPPRQSADGIREVGPVGAADSPLAARPVSLLAAPAGPSSRRKRWKRRRSLVRSSRSEYGARRREKQAASRRRQGSPPGRRGLGSA